MWLTMAIVLTGCGSDNHTSSPSEKNHLKKCYSGPASGNGITLSNLLRDKNNSDFEKRKYIGLAQIAMRHGNKSDYNQYKSISREYERKSSMLHNQIIYEMHNKAISDLNYNSTQRISELWSYYENNSIQIILREDCMYTIKHNNQIYKDLISKSELISSFNTFK